VRRPVPEKETVYGECVNERKLDELLWSVDGPSVSLVFIITFSSLGPNTKRSRSCIVVSLELAL
jgi:hypothetical protein